MNEYTNHRRGGGYMENRHVIAVVSYLFSVIFVFIGFRKIFIYEGPDDIGYGGETVNSYVNGDAYNFIINANYATAYFVLALIFVVIGSTMLIVESINNKTAIANTVDQEAELPIIEDEVE